MSAIRYPIAANAERALTAPVGRAARETEAQALAGAEVRFVTEPAGPAFPTYEAALAAFAGRIDAGKSQVQPEDRYCSLREVMAQPPVRRPRAGKRAKPVYRDGRRWSPPPAPTDTVWRLSISYWRIIGANETPTLEQARKARRSRAALDPAAIRALAHQPLLPIKPQQPLDVGLFETPLPENPNILIPDE